MEIRGSSIHETIIELFGRLNTMTNHDPAYIALSRQLLIEGLTENALALQELIADVKRERIPEFLDSIQDLKDAHAAMMRYIASIDKK